MHNAAQGAMTCHFKATAQPGCLSKRSAFEWLNWNERNRRSEIAWIGTRPNELGIPGRRPATKKDRPPRQFMAKPDVLFYRFFKDQLRVEAGCGEILATNSHQRRSFTTINDFRNQFSHFTPLGWNIEILGLPRLLSDSINVIRMIAADPSGFQQFDELEKEATFKIMECVDRKLSALSF